MMLLQKFLLKWCILAFVLIIGSLNMLAEDYIEVGRDFNMFTSKNLQGYAKPFFTTFEESINTNLFTRADYPDHWQIGLDISIMGMLIPDDQKTFDAELPEIYYNWDIPGIGKHGETAQITSNTGATDALRNAKKSTITQPTIYGGEAFAVYAAPEPGLYANDFKSVTFVEGNSISFMPGMPIFQLIFGIPSGTQVRLKGWGFGVQGSTLLYLGINANQRIDHFFHLFDDEDQVGLAVNLAYHILSRSGITANSFSVGAHFSKAWESGLGVYTGLQYENLSGTFLAKREFDANYISKSPYSEIRKGKDLKFDIDGFNSFRILAGVSYKASIFEFHADAAYASQPVFSFGISFWFANIGEKETEVSTEKYEKTEIKTIETKKTEEKKESSEEIKK